MGRGILLSILGGAAAAGLWAMVASLTGYEAGIVAWVVGLLTGLGMMAGRGKASVRSRQAGVAAAAIAVLAILGGKFAAVHIIVQNMIASEQYTDEDALASLEWETYERFQSEGRSMSEFDEDMPPEVVAEAERTWRGMTLQERGAYVAQHAAQANAEAQEAAPFLTGLAFIFSFGFFDLFWVGLAVSTAYKAGATGNSTPAEAQPAAQDEIAPVGGNGFWRPIAEPAPAERTLPFVAPTAHQPPASEHREAA